MRKTVEVVFERSLVVAEVVGEVEIVGEVESERRRMGEGR